METRRSLMALVVWATFGAQRLVLLPPSLTDFWSTALLVSESVVVAGGKSIARPTTPASTTIAAAPDKVVGESPGAGELLPDPDTGGVALPLGFFAEAIGPGIGPEVGPMWPGIGPAVGPMAPGIGPAVGAMAPSIGALGSMAPGAEAGEGMQKCEHIECGRVSLTSAPRARHPSVAHPTSRDPVAQRISRTSP